MIAHHTSWCVLATRE